ncbi:hypothetical protein DFH28DRAFT_1173944 [Melampsora americana]|nr:hypothetical protein DFH28DRAFT_1173944 [Melampsora americana]
MVPDAQLAQWESLHREYDHQSALTSTPSLRTVFILCIFLSPLSGILYGLSMIKRLSNPSERWLVRKDFGGYYHPNSCVLIPLWATLYTIADIISLLTCFLDLDSHPHLLTFAMETIKYGFFLGMAWTKVWATIYVAPRSRFQIQHNKPITSSSDPKTTRMRRWLLPKIFNLFIILGYLIPLILSSLVCAWTTMSMNQIMDLLYKYEAANEITTGPLLSSNKVSNIHLAKGFTYLISIKDISQKLTKNLRSGFYIYFLMTAFMFITLSLATAVILQTMYFQLEVLKTSASRPRRMSSEISLSYPQIPGTVRLIPAQASNFIFRKPPGLLSEKPSRSPCSNIESRNLVNKWSDWLPTFKRGTGIDSTMWSLPAFSKNFEEYDIDVNIKAEQYRILKTYTVNIIWQHALACAVSVSYLAMFGLMITTWCKAEHEIPLPRVLLILVEWSNLTWDLGIGFTLALVSLNLSLYTNSKPNHVFFFRSPVSLPFHLSLNIKNQNVIDYLSSVENHLFLMDLLTRSVPM